MAFRGSGALCFTTGPEGTRVNLSPGRAEPGVWGPTRVMTLGVEDVPRLKLLPMAGPARALASALGFSGATGGSGAGLGLVGRDPSRPAGQGPSLLLGRPVTLVDASGAAVLPLGPGAPPGTCVREKRAMGSGWHSLPPRAGGGPVRPLRARNTRWLRIVLWPLGGTHWGAMVWQLTRCHSRLCIQSTSG